MGFEDPDVAVTADMVDADVDTAAVWGRDTDVVCGCRSRWAR